MAKMAAMLAVLMSFAAAASAQEPPPLPPGLEPPKEEEPSTEERAREEPALPPGLIAPREEADAAGAPGAAWTAPFGLAGFIEGRLGARIVDDDTQKTVSVAEARLQLARDFYAGPAAFRVVGDFVIDGVEDELDVDLEQGRGFLDLREANVVLRPLEFVDLKAGRQILTWGVGDLVFINDLFPKDFRAFFIGRDVEYLKAPSDAIRVSAFHDIANLDIVYTPRFDADRFIDGSRLSYFNPSLGRIAGRDAIIKPSTPDAWFQDDELAARIHRMLYGYEIAAYVYQGFWKTPEGQSSAGIPIHPRLTVFGASLRGAVRGGVLTAEFGRYVSNDDRRGDDPLIRNGESRFLVGYEKEVGAELTAAAQYYVEIRSDFKALRSALPSGARIPERSRHTLTLRLTKLMLNQNLSLSAFNFWSPNEEDGHLRLRASYKLSDDWLVEGGGNFFYGARESSFFGQLQDNTNLFVGVRRSF